MALILYPDGRQETVQPANGSDFQLDELHKIVDGYIEMLPTKDERIMVINDEGKLKGLPRNEQATRLVDFMSPEEIQAALIANKGNPGFEVMYLGDPTQSEWIAGTALVCEPHEVE